MSRQDKITEAIKQYVSSIIHDDLRDPRIGFVTVTKVEMSDDLKYAKVFVSVLGETKKRKETFDALEKAKGFIRRGLAHRLDIRFVPQLLFKEDKSIEYSVYIEKKIDEANKISDNNKE